MKINSKKTEYIILGIILLIGLIVRLFNYSSFSLSNDELSAIYRLNYTTLHDLIAQGVGVDYHPAGVQVFLYYWVHLFGNSEASIRLPFVIAGTLAVLFTYLYSRRWFGPAPSLFSAAAIALLEYPIIYSQIARPYASGLMLSLFLAWLWSIVLIPKKKEKRHIWLYSVLLGFAFAFNLYNHYFSALLAFIIGVSAIVFLKKENYKPYFLALIIGSLLFTPHISMTLHHMSKGGLSTWLGAPTWWWPIDHIEHIFTNIFTFASIIIVIIYLRIKGVTSTINSKIRPLLFVFFLLPLAIGFFYSLYVNPVIQNSVLIFSMPYIIVWFFSFIPSNLNLRNLVGLLFVSSIMFYSSFFDRTQTVVDIQNFKGIAESLIKWKNEFPNKKIIRIMDSNSPEYIKYYLKDDTVNIKFAQWKIRDDEDLLKLKNILDTTKASQLNYVLLSNFNNTAFNMMANKFPYESHLNGNYAPNSIIFYLSNYKIKHSTYLAGVPNNCLAKFTTPVDNQIKLQDIEYSPGIEFNITDKYIKDAQHNHIDIQTSMHIISSSAIKKAHLVFSIDYEDEKKEDYWHSAPLKYFIYPNRAQDFYFNQALPSINEKAKIKVYIWNPEHEEITIDKLKIILYQTYHAMA